jgi:peptidoglycan/LPS O-acetylase OafA/YrhL
MHKYRPDIDGLRAIAVTLVVAFHAFPSWVKGGFIGVDIFFVISGYLITKIIIDDLANGRFSVADFYERRIRRIFPALLVVLTATLIFGWYVLLADEFSRLGWHVLSGVMFFSNITLWSELGYFDAIGETKPLLHLWSLGIEEQFYLVWPLLLAFLSARTTKTLAIICFFIFASLLTNVALVGSNASAAFFFPIARFWELLVGALLAYTQAFQAETIDKLTSRFGNIISIFGAAFLLAAIALISRDKQFPGWWATLPVFGTVMLILSGTKSYINLKILSIRPLVWLGIISYPLYLWHWPLLSYLWIINGGLPPKEAKLIAVLLSIFLGWLTFRFIEHPFRFGSLRSHSSLSLLSCSLVVCALSIMVTFGYAAPRIDNPQVQKLVTAANDYNYLDGFSVREFGNSKFHVLDTGNFDVTLFIGDSHIQQYGPRIVEIARNHRSSMRTAYLAALGGCVPIPNVYDRHNEPACSSLRDQAIKLASNPKVKTVVIGGCWNCYFIHQTQVSPSADPGTFSYYFLKSGRQVPFRGSDGASLAKDQLSLFIRDLKLLNKPVYFVLDNPYSLQQEPKHYLEGSRISREFSFKNVPSSIPSMGSETTLHSHLTELAVSSGAFVIDPRQQICSADKCSLLDADKSLIFQDRNHFTADYVKRNASFIDRTLLD